MSSTESPDATISPSASNGSIQERNDVTQRETGSDSTPDLIHKANLPVLLIGGGEDEEEEVKSKVSKTHTRGSSISSAPGSNQGYVSSPSLFPSCFTLFFYIWLCFKSCIHSLMAFSVIFVNYNLLLYCFQCIPSTHTEYSNIYYTH